MLNKAVRDTLRGYASGMGLEYRDVLAQFTRSSRVQQGRALHQMRALEAAWEQELAARSVESPWRRAWARIMARLVAWRLGG